MSRKFKTTTNTMAAGITKEMRREVYRRDGWRCALCDATDGIQIHHAIPRGQGGADHPWNLITLCWRCHAACHGSYYDESYCTYDDRDKLADDMQLECIRYLGDYYNELEGAWYPYDG